MEGVVKQSKGQEMYATKRGDQALPPRMKQEWMKQMRRGEPPSKMPVLGGMREPAGLLPFDLTTGEGDYQIQGKLGALQGEGHTVAGKRRNHRQRVAHAQPVLRRYPVVETQRSDGAKRIRIGCRGGKPLGQRIEPGSP